MNKTTTEATQFEGETHLQLKQFKTQIKKGPRP